MYKFPWLATIVASVLVSSSSLARAQGTTSVVVLDVARVFKQHLRFKQAMEAMKKEVAAFDAEMRRKRDAIQKNAEAVRKHKAGSAERTRLEARTAKAMSDLQVEMALKRKELMKREARLYYDTYADMTQAVATFADRNGIRLVLRFNGEEMERDDRASVQQGVSKTVVFQRNLNITDVIIQEVNRGTTAAGAGGGAFQRR